MGKAKPAGPRKPRAARLPREALQTTNSSRGGHLKAIPKPHFRRYKANDPDREIVVHAHTYTGVGHHVYVMIEEAPNPIWNAARKQWVETWDDPGSEGWLVTNKFESQPEAMTWVREILRKKFPRHENIRYENEARRWFYPEHD